MICCENIVNVALLINLLFKYFSLKDHKITLIYYSNNR